MQNKTPQDNDNFLSELHRELTDQEYVELAAERVAELIWDHWLYMQEQKKKEKEQER